MNNYKIIWLICILITSKVYAQDGKNDSTENLILKQIGKNPENRLALLFYNPDVSFADSLIKIIAREEPEDLYTYSQAKNSTLGKRIHAIDDPLVKLIADIADRKDGRLYFPFLGNLIAGKITMPEISKTFGSKTAYFKLLVITQISYNERLKRGDTVIGLHVLLDKLKKNAVADFINEVNGLHDKPDHIRLKVINSFKATELYYLCVAGADVLYTSSYLKIYDLIFKFSETNDGYDLLNSVHFDYYRRFLKLASNFNTLSDFLNRMSKPNADSIIRSFANGLERLNSLENAVDVADSYASIKDPEMRSLILAEVQKNLARLNDDNNKAGKTIYKLLNTIFLSMESSGDIDIASNLGISPVYQLSNQMLSDKTGKIIIQEFFYGDEDGKTGYRNFLKAYHNTHWKIVTKKYWVEIRSIQGANVVIYLNKPLDENTYQDIKAQETLSKYLKTNKLIPTILIHRGHSYFVKYTVQHLTAAVKLVILGSCGGYNNLNEIIKASPDVHIIATKQEGSVMINQPIIVYITELLREGKNLEWRLIWKSLDRKFTGMGKFEDYIPPYQNLGAIFIMAYNKAFNK